jgi:hypothetical protein
MPVIDEIKEQQKKVKELSFKKKTCLFLALLSNPCIHYYNRHYFYKCFPS